MKKASPLTNNDYNVAITGGGPAGLFLGICLQKLSISCCVLEKRVQPIAHSRSIGIHPVSLEAFGKDLASRFIEKGIKVTKGLAFWESQKVGALSFDTCPPPYRFILTLPQHKTERLLIACLNKINPFVLRRNCKVVDIKEKGEKIELAVTGKDRPQKVTADYVVACDGMNSFIRKSKSISFQGKTYNDTYVMGDFTDNTKLEKSAAIFLGGEGLVESFPLSDNLRRWVIKTDQYISEVKRKDVESRVKQRTGFSLQNTENSMLSSFGAFNKRAETMAKDRVLLAGDAAHVLSPIGGQGMNLGWLDAHDLVRCFQQIYAENAEPEKVLKNYSKRRLNAARKASLRANFNMFMGRKATFPFFKKALLKALVTPPISKKMAKVFTMRKIDQ